MKKTLAFLLLCFSMSLAAQSGLTGEYFQGQNFEEKITERTDAAINFDWGLGQSPAAGMPKTDYSVRWTGKIVAPETGEYVFSAVVDDGLRVWVGGNPVINAWALNDNIDFSNKIHLAAGQEYDLKVEYFNGPNEGSVILKWRLPSEKSKFGSWFDSDPKPVPARVFLQKNNSPAVSQPARQLATKPEKKQKTDAPSEKPAPKIDPPPVAEPQKQVIKVDSIQKFIPKNIQFVKSKSVILPESYAELDNLVAMLKRHPEFNLTIAGHTDQIGNADLNMELSKKRAQKVASYLVKHGIAAERLRAFGYGSTRPIDQSGTPEGLAKNRRVEFEILGY